MKPIFFATDNDPISILTRSRFHLSWAESEDTLPTIMAKNLITAALRRCARAKFTAALLAAESDASRD